MRDIWVGARVQLEVGGTRRVRDRVRDRARVNPRRSSAAPEGPH